jgi:protein tyrosine/serine phosphatase
MATDRQLEWDGCFNARDLGGLRAGAGRTTRRGAIVRADTLDHLTPSGWAAVRAYGIRTIVDLRNDAEIPPESRLRPAGISTVHVPLDDVEDTAFWQRCWDNELDGSPLYYQPFLEQKPGRCAAALAAIARAEPGGVVFHCGLGRDRTGLVSLLLLALAGVEPDEIVADYELSNSRLGPAWAARGQVDQRPIIDAILARRRTTARELLLALLATLDAAAYLRAAGLRDAELNALRARLLGPGAL